MTYLGFYLFENGVSSGMFTEKPLLNTVCSCMSRRGSSKLFLKTSYDDPVYQSGEFLKKKVATNLLHGSIVKGAPQAITDQLCPLMPSNRSTFWKNLPTNENVTDLIDVQ